MKTCINRFRFVSILASAGLAISVAEARVLTGTYNCGTQQAGTVTANVDDSVSVFGGPFNCVVGDWTLNAGTNMSAAATATLGQLGTHLAWMQAVTTNNGRAEFRTAGNTALTAPFADTPPGGYRVNNVCGEGPFNPQVFDNQPWYGNNTVGQLNMSDQPKNGVQFANGICTINFETWLVCAIDTGGNTWDVVPLAGFTWGFTYQRNGDGPDVGNINGDSVSEYTGTTSLSGAFLAGPSAAFRTGYTDWFSVRFLDNTDENCQDCIPGPGVLAAAGSFLLIGSRRRR